MKTINLSTVIGNLGMANAKVARYPVFFFKQYATTHYCGLHYTWRLSISVRLFTILYIVASNSYMPRWVQVKPYIYLTRALALHTSSPEQYCITIGNHTIHTRYCMVWWQQYSIYNMYLQHSIHNMTTHFRHQLTSSPSSMINPMLHLESCS